MDDSKVTELRRLTGRHNKLLYEAVKAGEVDEVPPESQTLARAMSEHMHLKHVHNALEFADLRDGEAYEIEVNGHVVSPLAHVAMHAAAKGQVEADHPVRAAFEKLVATGASAHHAEHVLAALFAELYFDLGQAAEAGTDVEKARARYYRKIKKITRDAFFRKKLLRQFPADHVELD
jgi:chemotaxis response regulator CheB